MTRSDSAARIKAAYIAAQAQQKPSRFEEWVLDSLPETYFEVKNGSYWLKLKCGRFLNLDGRSVKIQLMRDGYRIDGMNQHGLKDGDAFLGYVQMSRFVDYAGPLVGHKMGIFSTQSGERVLVTTEAKPVQPKKGDCSTIEKFLVALFDSDQTTRALLWLKCAWESLTAGDMRPGQVSVLAGPSGCGKNFFQLLVTRLLGGRSARPFRYMMGETQFNADLAQAEHLTVADEKASPDIRSRRNFGNSIKDFAVNEEMSVHDKGKKAISLPTFRRMSISVNSEHENLMIVPPLDPSILDKVNLFKCSPAAHCLNSDRKKNGVMLDRELPALVYELGLMPIPKKLRCQRYGVTAYHNTELLEILGEISPEQRLLNLIDEVLPWQDGEWSGSAEELEKGLRSSQFCFAVEKLLSFPSACGTYLARLQSRQPARFAHVKNNGKTKWLIKK